MPDPSVPSDAQVPSDADASTGPAVPTGQEDPDGTMTGSETTGSEETGSEETDEPVFENRAARRAKGKDKSATHQQAPGRTKQLDGRAVQGQRQWGNRRSG